MSKKNNGDQHKMGPVMLTALVAGNMMGSGVFLLPANLAHFGGISLYGWIVTVVGAVALALVFSELGLINPKAGGPYAYAKEGFGDYLGFQTVYVYWLGNWIGNVAIAVAGVGYLSYFFPELRHPLPAFFTSLIAVWIFTSINFFGARNLGRLLTATTFFMFIPVLGTAILGWFWFKSDIFNAAFNVSGHSDLYAVTHSATLTLWAFIGVESASVSAGVVRNPSRNIPLATMFGTLLAAAAYVLSSTAIMGMVPNAKLALSSAPFSVAAVVAFGPVAGFIASACAVIACFGSLGGWMLLVGQSAKAASDDLLFPRFFSKVSKRKVPILGLCITALLMSLLLLLTISPHISEQFQEITLTAVLLTLLPYLYSAVSMIIIGYRAHLPVKTYRRFIVIALIATIYSLWAFTGISSDILLSGFIIMLLSVPFYAWVLWNRKHINITYHHSLLQQNGIAIPPQKMEKEQ